MSNPYQAEIETSGVERLVGEITFTDAANQPASSAAVAYVHVHAGAPSPLSTFVTPLWFDSTGTSGGLYAWTGTTYTKVGLATT